MENLKLLRQKIDTVDAAIIKKLALRQKLSKKIGQLKANSGKSIRDFSRETAQKKQYQELCLNYQLEFEFVNKLFKLIIAHSRGLQKK